MSFRRLWSPLLSLAVLCHCAGDDGSPSLPYLDPGFEGEQTCLVTEFSARADDGDWVEIKNIGDSDFSSKELVLGHNGQVVFDGSIHDEITLLPGDYLVVGKDLPAAPNHFNVPNFSLDDDIGSIVVGSQVQNTTFDSINYDKASQWPVHKETTTRLHPTLKENDKPLDWCTHGLGVVSSLGTENPPCLFATPNDSLRDQPQSYSLGQQASIALSIAIAPEELDALNQVVDKSPPGVGPFEATFTLNDGTSLASTIEVRGGSSRLSPQKSFKVKIPDPLFQKQNILNLNKSPFDYSRMRNRIGFELIREIPNLIGLRTQFVTLRVNNEDYGLFTHVEQVNERSLRQHGLDSRGHLWKPVNFDFGDPDVVGDELFIKQNVGNNANELKSVIAKLNNENVATEAIIEEHFNKDNLLHWLATYYLLDNRDSTSQNYYLYSPPKEPSRFYFLPWDFDGAFDWYNQHGFPIASSSSNLGNWWKVRLFERLMRSPNFLTDFQSALSSVYTSLDSGNIGELVDGVFSNASEVFFASPADANTFAIQNHDHAQDINAIKSTLTTRYNEFSSLSEKPMPFWSSAKIENQSLILSWSANQFDFQSDALSMTVLVSDGNCSNNPSRCFRNSNVVRTLSFGIDPNQVAVELSSLALPSGTYYCRFAVSDNKGNSQIEFDELFPNQIVIP